VAISSVGVQGEWRVLRTHEFLRFSKTMRACRRCLEAGYEITPGAVFSGSVPAPLMLVGQAPGVTEVQAGRPFNASSGRRLFQWLAEAGFEETEFRARYYMTAVTKCYPGKHPKGKGDRKPSRAEQKLCRPFLDRELEMVQPRVVLAVGGLAIETLLGQKLRLDEAVGRVFRVDGRVILPLPHPSGASLWPNRPENQALIHQAMALLRDDLTPLARLNSGQPDHEARISNHE
jgi:uracil-DNA glycosylase